MKNRGPSNTIRSEGWMRKQLHVNPCPKCGSKYLCMNRAMLQYGSKYFINCENCKHHNKAVFSFSPKRGLPRALRRWNKAK